MLTMDVFKQDAFSAVSLTAAIDKMDFVPDFLGSIPGLWVPDPVRTTEVWIEERETGAIILPFSPRGSAPNSEGGDIRKARAFSTMRVADSSRITASELLGIRAFGSETALKTLQSEVGRRQFKIGQNFNLTFEYHRFNCLTDAKVKDKNGTVVYDWATEFGQSIPGEVDFDLDNVSPAPGAIRKKCNAVRRSVLKGLKGVGSPSRIVALCGDNFYDDLTNNTEVRETFLNQQQASDLRNNHGQEWSTFRYGNIDFVNYRGTDDGSTLGVNTDKCHFFPVGAGIFRWATSPGESFEHVGQLGQARYSAIVTDKDRNAWADVEVYSYPLPVCTMPAALYKARRT